jgi:HAD superfamily hydrolase (TIGR01509 family)
MKLICFDMDGVLIDACNLHKVSLEVAMQEELGYKISDFDHYNKFNGLPTKKKLEMLGVDQEKIKKISDKKQKYTLELIEKHIKLDPSKIDLLQHIKSIKCSIACVTNSILLTTEIMLKKAGIYSYFDLIVSNESVKNPKPSPDPYIFAMNKLGFGPSQTVIIEDSPIGLKAAYSSGARVIEVKTSEEVNLKNLKDKL